MTRPSRFYIFLQVFLFWPWLQGAPLSSSVLKRRYISLQNEWMNEVAIVFLSYSLSLSFVPSLSLYSSLQCIFISLPLSLFVFLALSVCLCLSLSHAVSLSLFVDVFCSLSLCLSPLCFFLPASDCLTLSLYLCLTVCLFLLSNRRRGYTLKQLNGWREY